MYFHTWSPSGARCTRCDVGGTGDTENDGPCRQALADAIDRDELRQVIASAFDWSISGPAFAAGDELADALIERVRYGDDLDDVSAEIADGAVPVYTGDLLAWWQGLNAQNAAAEMGYAEPTTDADTLIRQDVFAVLDNATGVGANWLMDTVSELEAAFFEAVAS